MFSCPNCGGALRFDIETQSMLCDHCQTKLDPENVSDHRAAEEQNQFETTRFLCPSCGAEMIGDDTTAAAFCSFCGASNILQSRISRELRPDRIIPFKITKKQCAELYTNHMKKAKFAPKELKDSKCIDSFRGIYMPYWMYGLDYDEPFETEGTTHKRQGDYDVTRYYSLSGQITGSFSGITHDASTSFSDDISESMAPYDTRNITSFHPAYLSGFYADTQDVAAAIYQPDAENIAQKLVDEEIMKTPEFSKYSMNPLRKDPIPKWKPTQYAMFPVWFMSYRKGNRVSYVTINGQTGKIAADTPIDEKKYTLYSLLLALPIFLLLNMFFTLQASTALWMSGVVALITAILSITEYHHMQRKESGVLDRGQQSKKNSTGTKPKSALDSFSPILCFIALAIGLCILVFNPVSDYWYYSGAFFCILATFLTFTRILHNFNILATRKLPQFDRSGGDDRA